MRYTTKIEQSEESMFLIFQQIQTFDRDKVLDAIVQKRMDGYDVQQITALAKEYHAKLYGEKVALGRFAQDFLKQFATVNNKCYETIKMLFNKNRSTVCGIKKIYKKFCKHVRSKQIEVSALTHSLISDRPYARDFFGIETYGDAVVELCQELESFLPIWLRRSRTVCAFCRLRSRS